ncbi:hypothetical protein I350_05127 [Cryptococcus amylolentus CBS 6273]|uniref:Uncharacterized protein n=1 Tax=Cryptococcus amylolentus CBS 6273 TaxID=1296118 RepID=A0A1E3JUK5_9TREE|nr:hypothetical protein I350_05127 [Cryptococcus amylolentus CBS 6273]
MPEPAPLKSALKKASRAKPPLPFTSIDLGLQRNKEDFDSLIERFLSNDIVAQYHHPLRRLEVNLIRLLSQKVNVLVGKRYMGRNALSTVELLVEKYVFIARFLCIGIAHGLEKNNGVIPEPQIELLYSVIDEGDLILTYSSRLRVDKIDTREIEMKKEVSDDVYAGLEHCMTRLIALADNWKRARAW